YKLNTLNILNFSILNKPNFILYTDSLIRNKCLYIFVIFFYINHDIIDSFFINSSTAVFVHFSTRHFIVIKVPIRHEWSIRIWKMLFCFHTTWLVVINAKNIGSISLQKLAISFLSNR